MRTVEGLRGGVQPVFRGINNPISINISSVIIRTPTNPNQIAPRRTSVETPIQINIPSVLIMVPGRPTPPRRISFENSKPQIPKPVLPEKPPIPSSEVKRNLPIDPIYPFNHPEREKEVKKLIELTGLPVSGVKKLAYKPNRYSDPGVQASAEIPNENLPKHLREYYSGRLTFYSEAWNYTSPKERLGITVHELWHFHNPFLIDNNDKYGSGENRGQHARHVMEVAKQSEQTMTFLNNYHQSLYMRYKLGIIPKSVWLHETHAILGQMTATEPEQLRQKENIQREKLKMLGREEKMVEFVSKKKENGTWFISSTDKSFMAMTGKKSVEELQNHWKTATKEAEKNSFKQKEGIEKTYLIPVRRQNRIIILTMSEDNILIITIRRNHDEIFPKPVASPH